MERPDTIVYRGRGNIYLNITDRCSCSCSFCLAEFTDEVFGYDLTLHAEPDVEEIEQAIELEFMDGPADEVVFCGLGEPTMRLDDVLAVTEWLRLRRIPSRLVTNGHGELLNPDRDVATELAAAGLGAVTVSLNAADPATYDELCRPMFSKAYRAVIRFAQRCVEEGIPTTMTALEQPGVDLEDCEALARALGAEFRARYLVTPPAEREPSEGRASGGIQGEDPRR
ncbi:MAG TPA: TatD family nuclease-associated radical SAM protein [Thermoleophilia bacterium]|nr:TatD family nuclease-associated radical SAM protein [Thermoleophilia bacterium]